MSTAQRQADVIQSLCETSCGARLLVHAYYVSPRVVHQQNHSTELWMRLHTLGIDDLRDTAMAEIFKDARKKEYLNAEGADKPLKSPIPLDT